MKEANKKRWGLIIGLLILFLFQCIYSLKFKSLTYDELVHLTAGYIYWKKGVFSYNLIHPPLPNLIEALPLLFIKGVVLPEKVESHGDYYKDFLIAEEFFSLNREKIPVMIWLGKSMVLLLAILLGILLYLWGKKLYGPTGGLISLFFYSFSPSIIAHARLITTDLFVTFCIFGYAYFLVRLLHSLSLKDTLLCGFFLGMALASKYSALIILPFSDLSPSKISIFLILMTTSFLTLALAYGFLHFSYYGKGFIALWKEVFIEVEELFHGRYSFHGFWFYFPFLFFHQNPSKHTVFNTLRFLKKRKNLKLDEWVIIGLPFFFFLLILKSKIQIGHRHLLPIYPFLFTCWEIF